VAGAARLLGAALAIDGYAHNFDYREDDHDYYSQPGNLFRMFSTEEKQRLFENTARALAPASKEVRDRRRVFSDG
jgi:catalase